MGLISQFSNRARNALWNWLNEGRQSMLLTKEEKQKQSLVTLAQRYYDGDHDVKLTKRQQEWLDQHPGTVKFTVNHCPTIVDAVVGRLQVIGFDVADEDKDAPPEGKLSTVAWEWWQENRMDAVQTEAYRKAGIAGETFMLVSWDNDEQRPDWVLHPRFVDTSAGGSGYGMWIEYPNGDYLQKPTRAIKQWTEESADGKTTLTRRTVYYPERIEKLVLGKDGAWEPYKVEGSEEPWPLPWVGKDNKPLGIPVAHFRNPGLKSDLAEIVPLQDALNKSWLDLLAAEDSTAFRTLIMVGMVPTKDGKLPKDDGSNLLKLLPGQMWATKDKPTDVQIHTLDPASLQPLLDAEERIVLRMASVSGTPVNRFLITRQIQSAEGQKEGEAALLEKIRERHVLLGNAWEDVIRISTRLANTFGSASYDDKPKVATVWESAQVRNEKEHIEELQGKQALGVDDETIWAELGYDEAKIKDFKLAKTKKAAREALALRRQQQQPQGASDGQDPGQQEPPAAAAA
jgi:hypothetical protein